MIANILDILFFFSGGFDGRSSNGDILTFNTNLQTWNHNFSMKSIRSGHAASVVSAVKISGYCNNIKP